MKDLFKKVVKIAVVVIIVMTAIGIFIGEDDTVDIEFDYNAYIEDDIVYIEGETNLLDGVIIHYEVDTLDVLSDEMYDGNITVQDNSFYQEIDISNLEGEDVEVWLAFWPHSQPEDIQEVYGQWGENLEGDTIEYQETGWLDETDGYNEIWVLDSIDR